MAVVKVTLITNGGKKTDMLSDATTIRQIYEKHDVNYEACTNTVDSVPLRIGDLDKSLRELGCGESVRMSSIVKMDNAAETKVLVMGSCAVLKSRYKLEQWQKALKYEPDLGIYDDNDEKVFGVFIEEGPGALNANGVVFSSVADEDGYAVATLIIDPTEENKLEVVREKVGLGLINLKQVEDELGDVVAAAEQHEQEIARMVQSV